MKLASFEFNGKKSWGVVLNDNVLDVSLIDSRLPADLLTVLQQELISDIRIQHSDHLLPISQVKLLPPVLNPGLVVCLGLNYRDHADEVGLKYPKAPLLFSKSPRALAGARDDIIYPSNVEKLDYEVELALVIGKRAKNVSADEALNYVAGYSVLNDVSARCAQFADKQWFRGKSFDGFAPMGPYLVTVDEISNPNQLDLWCRVNGEQRQQSNTSNLIFSVEQIVSYVSQNMSLYPGDIIATGTPSGVGAFFDPPKLLQRGDVVEMGIGSLGELVNRII